MEEVGNEMQCRKRRHKQGQSIGGPHDIIEISSEKRKLDE